MNDMRPVAGIFIAIVVAFGVSEISRWRSADGIDILSALQKVRRIIGLLILLSLGAMLYAWTYLPDPRFMPRFVAGLEWIYLLFFFLLTAFLPLIAFFEWKDSIKKASQLRREVYRSIVTAPIESLPKPDDPPKKPNS
jgi:hypothetical protein